MYEWHYQRGETIFGPISGVTLHSLIQRGRLQGDTRVRRADMAEWSTVAQILPDLPTAPESPASISEQPASALPFDSSLPGASVIYAPPQSALTEQPQPRMPVFLWAGMLLCAGCLLLEIACWISMAFAHLSGHSSAWPTWLQQFAGVLTSFLNEKATAKSMVVTAVSLILWQACAFASLRKLYGGLMRRNLACGLWWLVPIAHLFKPLMCLRDMRYLSRTRRDVPDPQASFGPLLLTMEALILIPLFSRLLTLLTPETALPSGFSHSAAPSTVMQIVDDAGMIAFATVMLLIVISNFLQQRRLYAHWTDDAYWQDRWGH